MWDYTLQVLAAIDRQSAAIRPFTIEPGSRVDDLRRVFPDPPIDLGSSVTRSLDTSVDCVQQLYRYLTGRALTTPILIGTIMRSLLLSSSRVVFLLGPTDTAARKDHALRVLAQEAASLKRHFNAAKQIKWMAGLKPPEDILTGQTNRIEKVLAAAKCPPESTMLDLMVSEVGRILDSSEYASEVSDEMRGAFKETIMLAFHNYSGIAHGYAWPCAVPRTDSNLPHQFPTDVQNIASVCQLGLRLFSRQSHLASS